jgi:hypothetical protein
MSETLYSTKRDGYYRPSLDNVISYLLRNADIKNGDIITIFKAKKTTIPDTYLACLARRMLEYTYDDLSDEYAHPDYECLHNNPTEDINAKALELINLITSGFCVTVCDAAGVIKVKIVDIEAGTWVEVEK